MTLSPEKGVSLGLTPTHTNIITGHSLAGYKASLLSHKSVQALFFLTLLFGGFLGLFGGFSAVT